MLNYTANIKQKEEESKEESSGCRLSGPAAALLSVLYDGKGMLCISGCKPCLEIMDRQRQRSGSFLAYERKIRRCILSTAPNMIFYPLSQFSANLETSALTTRSAKVVFSSSSYSFSNPLLTRWVISQTPSASQFLFAN